MLLALRHKGVSFRAFTQVPPRVSDPSHIPPRAYEATAASLKPPTAHASCTDEGRDVRFTFTATYAAVTLCRGNGHDEVVAIRCVGARQPLFVLSSTRFQCISSLLEGEDRAVLTGTVLWWKLACVKQAATPKP